MHLNDCFPKWAKTVFQVQLILNIPQPLQLTGSLSFQNHLFKNIHISSRSGECTVLHCALMLCTSLLYRALLCSAQQATTLHFKHLHCTALHFKGL